MNKTLLVIALAIALTSTAFAGNTKGYTKKNGTRVAPHHQTAPDKSKANNYGTKGNTNPYTGKKGTIDPSKKK